MKALRWHGRNDVRLDDVPAPKAPGPREVQLRVLWCGICGTDVEEWRNGPLSIPSTKAPLTLGHELSGEVIGTGTEVVDLAVGDYVAVDGVSYCGVCRECVHHRFNLCKDRGQIGLTVDGGLQEVVNVPSQTCLRMPAGLAPEGGAIAETLSVGVRALRQGRLVPGERVAVFGAGAVGLLALQAARAFGAEHLTVVDPLRNRRQLALDLGADVVLDINEGDAGFDVDVVLECSGNPKVIPSAIAAARSSGRIVLVGASSAVAQVATRDVVIWEKSLIGSASHVWDTDFADALQLLGSGVISFEPLLTRVGLSDSLDLGLRALADRPEQFVKIVVSRGVD